jgi:hypothetical protein
MKTNSLFLTVVFAAALLGVSVPQGHSQIGGYYNAAITNGYNFLANPFDATDNNITNVISAFPAPPDGTAVYLWNIANQSFDPPAVFYSTNGWSRNFNVPPGLGFVLSSTSAWTLTFVGTILQGFQTNFVAGTNGFCLLGSHFPVSGNFADATMTNFPAVDGANVYLFRPESQSYSNAYTYFGISTNRIYGWFDPDGVVLGTNGPTIAIAQGFFLQDPGPPTNWVQNYTASSTQPQSLAARSGPSGVSLRRVGIIGGKLTLQVNNPTGNSYSVWSSADGRSWTSLASGQTGLTWTGPPPLGRQGFYKVTSP